MTMTGGQPLLRLNVEIIEQPLTTHNSLGWEVKMLLCQMSNTKLSVSAGAAPVLLAFLGLMDTARNI